MPTLRDYKCPNCGHIKEELVNSIDEIVRCEECGTDEGQYAMEWLPTPVGILTSDASSYLDGTKRKGWADLREANKLECKSYELPEQERGEINKEISRLKRTKGEQ